MLVVSIKSYTAKDNLGIGLRPGKLQAHSLDLCGDRNDNPTTAE